MMSLFVVASLTPDVHSAQGATVSRDALVYWCRRGLSRQPISAISLFGKQSWTIVELEDRIGVRRLC